MTPFDAVALLAMLLAFYPRPSGASLLRARAERPDYFAGGTVIGSSHTHLQLPDGRIWDLVFDEGSSRARWQVLFVDPTDPGAGDADPFPLEAGPLDSVDEELVIFPETRATFAPLVAGALAELTGADDVLRGAGDAVTAADVAGDLDRSYRDLVEPAARAHGDMRTALDVDDPSDVIAATENHGAAIDAGEGAYTEGLPPDVAESDPGNAPPPEPEEPKPEPPAF